MMRVSSLLLVPFLTLGTGPFQNAPGMVEPSLQTGIKQFEQGDMAGAVFALEAVIRTLVAEPPPRAKELSQAYLYRGAAFVGLGQEESAKGSFATALRYDKNLRIAEDKFSARVVRVFEAARLGKTKSVLLPPSKAKKKAGVGALGVGAIVAGVAAAGGGIAAATHGSSPAPEPTPLPTPPPGTPVTSTGGIRIAYVAANPPPGSTISTRWIEIMFHAGYVLQIAISFTSPSVPSTGSVELYLYAPQSQCAILLRPSDAGERLYPADTPTTVTFGPLYLQNGAGNCLAPNNYSFTTSTVDVSFIQRASPVSKTTFNLTYDWRITQ